MTTADQLTRRSLLATTAIAGTGLLLGKAFTAEGDATAGRRKRYALVGVGSRAGMYRQAVLKTYAQYGEMVGYCDNNEGRLKLAQAQAKKDAGVEVPIFAAADFERMVRETRPDTVIVTTRDSAHDLYIIKAMELGCDVITEKPMTIDDERCRNIFAARERTGRKLTVCFNYRYSPPRTQVKEMLMDGIIGEVLSVDFHWLLNTHHGADYFRRWHSNKANSGGLMVHKATHHFDLVNWWLSGVPVAVQANGKRDFYTPAMAKRLGLASHHERCLTCPEKKSCPFVLELDRNKGLKELYLDNEQFDGYVRDRCVFRPDIDIEDTMNLAVSYDTGATLSYSLNAFNAWEGYHIAFNGTKGRLEHKMVESMSINGDGSVPGAIAKEGVSIRVFPMRAAAYEVKVWEGKGGHGGGDDVMLKDVFQPEKDADRTQRAADHRSGALSILTGIAANRSIVSGERVRIADLVPGIARPDYPAMPGHDTAVKIPM